MCSASSLVAVRPPAPEQPEQALSEVTSPSTIPASLFLQRGLSSPWLTCRGELVHTAIREGETATFACVSGGGKREEGDSSVCAPRQHGRGRLEVGGKRERSHTRRAECQPWRLRHPAVAMQPTKGPVSTSMGLWKGVCVCPRAALLVRRERVCFLLEQVLLHFSAAQL